jgi:hypothetical protein
MKSIYTCWITMALAACQGEASCEVGAFNYESLDLDTEITELRVTSAESGEYGPNELDSPLAVGAPPSDPVSLEIGQWSAKLLLGDGTEITENLYCDKGDGWRIFLPVTEEERAAFQGAFSSP